MRSHDKNVTHNIIASHTKNENQESLVSQNKNATHNIFAKPKRYENHRSIASQPSYETQRGNVSHRKYAT